MVWGEKKDGAGEKQPHLLGSLVKSMPSYIYIYMYTHTHIYIVLMCTIYMYRYVLYICVCVYIYIVLICMNLIYIWFRFLPPPLPPSLSSFFLYFLSSFLVPGILTEHQ